MSTQPLTSENAIQFLEEHVLLPTFFSVLENRHGIVPQNDQQKMAMLRIGANLYHKEQEKQARLGQNDDLFLEKIASKLEGSTSPAFDARLVDYASDLSQNETFLQAVAAIEMAKQQQR